MTPGQSTQLKSLHSPGFRQAQHSTNKSSSGSPGKVKRRKTILLDTDSEDHSNTSSSEELDYSHAVQNYRKMKEELKKVETYDEDAED